MKKGSRQIGVGWLVGFAVGNGEADKKAEDGRL